MSQKLKLKNKFIPLTLQKFSKKVRESSIILWMISSEGLCKKIRKNFLNLIKKIWCSSFKWHCYLEIVIKSLNLKRVMKL